MSQRKKLSAICFNMRRQNLVLQWGEETFSTTRKVHNPAGCHHIDLNRILWASNLVNPENYLTHFSPVSHFYTP